MSARRFWKSDEQGWRVSAQAPPSITPLPPILWGRGKRQRYQPLPLLPAYRTISRQKATAAAAAAAAVGFTEKELSATVSQQPIWNAPTSNGISTGQKRIIDQRWKKKKKRKREPKKLAHRRIAHPPLFCVIRQWEAVRLLWGGRGFLFYFSVFFSFFPYFSFSRKRKKIAASPV